MTVNMDIWGELELCEGIMNPYDRLNGYLNDDKGDHYAVIRRPDGSRYAAMTSKYVNCKEETWYSLVNAYDDYLFRYNYSDGLLEIVTYEGADVVVLDSVGLSQENWEDVSARHYYYNKWINDMNEELKYMM